MSQISINSKTEENERLKEYIQMEQEKLDEAKKFLDEDKEKFEKLMIDSRKMTEGITAQVKAKIYEKQKLIKNTENLNNKISTKDSVIKKFNDDLVVFK